MSDNVVSLRGGGISPPKDEGADRPVNETAVAELERLLALAKAGEIIGSRGRTLITTMSSAIRMRALSAASP